MLKGVVKHRHWMCKGGTKHGSHVCDGVRDEEGRDLLVALLY